MSKVPVTNRKVPVTLLILIVRDICYIARDNYGKYGRDKLVLTRDTFRKSARDRAKMPVTNSKKSVSRPLLGVTGKKKTLILVEMRIFSSALMDYTRAAVSKH